MVRIQLTLLAICFLLTTSCGDRPASNQGVSTNGFDVTGYETNAMPDGVTQVIKRDGNGLIKEEGYIENGMKTGIWTTYIDDRAESITSYVGGRKYGKSFEFDHRRQIVEEATYVNNQLYGKSGSYKFGRPKLEANYVNGKLHGPYKKYFESGADQGKINQYVDYLNGVIHGKVKYYNGSGEVTVEYDYKNGKKTSGGMVE